MAKRQRKKPVIGVTASDAGGRAMWWCNWLALKRADAEPVRITAKTRDDAPPLDGLLVGGGDDIGPGLYHGELMPAVRADPARDQLELDLLKSALGSGMPVMGICRGAQMINIVLGGSLYQDIYKIYKEAPHVRTVLPRKCVSIVKDSLLHNILGAGHCYVNALHHQSIDRLGAGLQVVARDEQDIVQAVERPEGAFLLGVQWHPEFLILDRAQQSLFRALSCAARRYAG